VVAGRKRRASIQDRRIATGTVVRKCRRVKEHCRHGQEAKTEQIDNFKKASSVFLEAKSYSEVLNRQNGLRRYRPEQRATPVQPNTEEEENEPCKVTRDDPGDRLGGARGERPAGGGDR
jgi:hypothetical protein